jgi:hypothetical protein
VRVVIDTNVLVSGVINPHGPPGRIVDHALAGAFTVKNEPKTNLNRTGQVLVDLIGPFETKPTELPCRFYKLGAATAARSPRNASTLLRTRSACTIVKSCPAPGMISALT